MDDEEQLKEYERKITELEKELKESYEAKNELQKKISFEKTPEGDFCNAEIGDTVIVIRDSKRKGKKGIVREKKSGTLYYKDEGKVAFSYEVEFPDGSALEYFHAVLRKVDD